MDISRLGAGICSQIPVMTQSVPLTVVPHSRQSVSDVHTVPADYGNGTIQSYITLPVGISQNIHLEYTPTPHASINNELFTLASNTVDTLTQPPTNHNTVAQTLTTSCANHNVVTPFANNVQTTPLPTLATALLSVTATTVISQTSNTKVTSITPAAPPTTTVVTNTVTAQTSASAPSASIIVKQYQPVRPYKGNTPWSTYRDYFERCAKVNNWVTLSDKVQHLSLSLEGQAADILKDINDNSPTAYEDIWAALSRRFGDIDEPREAMRRFDNRRQLDHESIAEYEQALRTLYRQGWPNSTPDHKDQTLKRRFEDDFLSSDLTQYLRLHTRDANFTETVQHPRRFIASAEVQKPKKSNVRIASPAHETVSSVSTVSQPVIDRLQHIEEMITTIQCASASNTNQVRIILNHHGLSTSQTQVSHRVYGKIIIPVVHPDLHHNGSLPHREISDHHVQREGIQHRGSLLIPTTPQDVPMEHNVADVGYVISQDVTQTDTRTSQTLLHLHRVPGHVAFVDNLDVILIFTHRTRVPLRIHHKR